MLTAEPPVRPLAPNHYEPHVRDKSRWMVPLNPIFDMVADPVSGVNYKGLYGVHEFLIPRVDEYIANVTPGWTNDPRGTPWGKEWAAGFHDDTPERLLAERARDIVW